MLLKLKYFLLISVFHNLVWSFLLLPNLWQNAHVQHKIAPNSKNVGEPLLLTPYIKSNQTSKARELSNVKPFLKGVISNAGFLTVNETYNSNLFFWFFRKTSKDWEKAPLLLYLDGGPGATAMYGLFEENGPFKISHNKIIRRKFSLTNDYNVIYIDQPVGCGFSFTNSSKGRIHNQVQVADHLYEAVTQFYSLYPELKANAFYIIGESYAGRYITAIAYRIHTLKMAGKSEINLKGLFMLAASTDGISMTESMAEFCFNIGVIDSKVRDETQVMHEELKYYVHSELWTKANLQRLKIYENIQKNSNVSLHDYTKPPTPYDGADWNNFLKSSDTRKRIHVGNTSFVMMSWQVYADFNDDMVKSVKPWLEVLLDHYPIAFVGGQYDVIVAYVGNVRLMERLEWSGAFEYSKAIRRKLMDKKEVVGYYKSAGNLTDILILRAGHSIFKPQPKVTYDALIRFINNGF